MRRYTGMIVLLTALAAQVSGCNTFRGEINPETYIGKEPPMTLILAEYFGPQARATADRVCADLHKNGFPEAFVLADDDEATLCHSQYDGFDDKRYQPDKSRIAAIRDPSGAPAFGRPRASLLPELTPQTPYELTDARGKYTVQVGLFDLYGRKTQAVRFTEELRRKGYEAYTHHGDTQSLVTIGTFGDIIFDNPYRMGNPTDPAKIIAPDVKKLLAEFPFLNYNGHTFTAEEASQIQMTRRGVNPLTGRREEMTVDAAKFTRCQLVHIPKKVALPTQQQVVPPMPQPSGPILSPPRRW